jgi:ribose/xylose/arabinose/galactoside ABC-type transport system permease subunit
MRSYLLASMITTLAAVLLAMTYFEITPSPTDGGAPMTGIAAAVIGACCLLGACVVGAVVRRLRKWLDGP